MQIEAFSEMKDQKLIIVYDYDSGSQELRDYHDELTSKATGLENIIFIKAPERMELIKLYKESKGFITTSIGESFGTTASESMAAGTPVIAPRDGGYKYAVIDNETGILIDDINKEKLIEAIKLMDAQIMTDKYHYFNRCLDRAKKYSYTEFMRKINENLV